CFFFQAEDGIRDFHVTGVQTCALPIYAVGYTGGSHPATRANRGKANRNKDWSGQYREAAPSADIESNSEIGREFYLKFTMAAIRSEERRVGKECRSGGSQERWSEKVSR